MMKKRTKRQKEVDEAVLNWNYKKKVDER